MRLGPPTRPQLKWFLDRATSRFGNRPDPYTQSVLDTIAWVLGEMKVSPITGERFVRPPSAADMATEEEAAGRAAYGPPEQSRGYSADAVEATLMWIRGVFSDPPIDLAR